jgi:hypothetical protein
MYSSVIKRHEATYNKRMKFLRIFRSKFSRDASRSYKATFNAAKELRNIEGLLYRYAAYCCITRGKDFMKGSYLA